MASLFADYYDLAKEWCGSLQLECREECFGRVVSRLLVDTKLNYRVFLVAAFTSVAILAATFAVIEFSVSPLVAVLAIVILFSATAYIIIWRANKSDSSDLANPLRKRRTALGVLFYTTSLGAVYGLAAHRSDYGGWNIGDVVGISFAVVLLGLILFAIFPRK